MPEELAQVPGSGGVEGARKIIAGAQEFLSSSRKRPDDVKRETERRALLSGTEQLLEVPGVNEEVLEILAQAHVRSPEERVKAPIEHIASC